MILSAELYDIIRQIIVDQLHVSEDEITEDISILDDLHADSLDVVEMLMALEDATGVSIPDEDVEFLRTPADIVSYLEQHAQ